MQPKRWVITCDQVDIIFFWYYSCIYTKIFANFCYRSAWYDSLRILVSISYHLGLNTMQDQLYLGKIIPLTLWHRMVYDSYNNLDIQRFSHLVIANGILHSILAPSTTLSIPISVGGTNSSQTHNLAKQKLRRAKVAT